MKKPNILFVLADQFRKNALEDDPVIRPNFDQFVSESVWMEHAVSTIPICSPYRGMMMTGLLPYENGNGIISNCNTNTSDYGIYLKTNSVCWSDIMSENGYDLAYIGKWHLDPPEPRDVEFFSEGYRKGVLWDSYTPKSRRHGFNFWHTYGCCDSHMNPHYYHGDAPVEEPFYPKKWSAEHETEVAIDYIKNVNQERDETKPFAMVLSYNPPHPPFEFLPDRYKKAYEDKSVEELLVRDNVGVPPHSIMPILGSDKVENSKLWVQDYFAAITAVDEQFGKVLDALKAKGIDEDTIVIFTSDHGELMGSHNLMHKDRIYQECFEVPLIVRYPQKIKKGTRNRTVVQTVDWMPTLLSMAGLIDQVPGNVKGVDMTEYFYNGTEIDANGLFIDIKANIRGFKNQRYTYAVRKDYYGEETCILIDDQNDPYQLHDISAESEELCQKFRKVLEEMLVGTSDPWLGI